MNENENNKVKMIIFNLNNYKSLGITKYIKFYNLMCPKAREIHLNKYKLVGYDIPKYLNNKKIENFKGISSNYIYIILLFIIIIIIIIICDRLNIFSLG
jgi:hypothetical protein